MCTISWLPTDDGYEVRMNRDERRSRSPAEPPAVFDAGDGRAIAPRDPDGGGTWLGVNDRGLTVALANVYPKEPPPTHPDGRSRGLLVLDALACADVETVQALLEATDTGRLQPFHLLAFEPGQPALSVVWDGHGLVESWHSAPGLVATSSSRDQETAEQLRTSWFAAQAEEYGGYSGPLLDRLHRSRHPAPGPWAVSMERSDAATVSMSTIHTNGAQVSFEYTPGPPHRTGAQPAITLPRAFIQAGSSRAEGS